MSFQALLEFARSSDFAVKLSAPFRFSKEPRPYAEADDRRKVLWTTPSKFFGFA